MKSLMKLFGNRVARKNIVSLNQVQLRILGALDASLKRYHNTNLVVLTQVDISPGEIKNDSAGVHRDVVAEAYYTYSGIEHSKDRDLHHKIVLEIRFRADDRAIFVWEWKEIKFFQVLPGVPGKSEESVELLLQGDLTDQDRLFRDALTVQQRTREMQAYARSKKS